MSQPQDQQTLLQNLRNTKFSRGIGAIFSSLLSGGIYVTSRNQEAATFQSQTNAQIQNNQRVTDGLNALTAYPPDKTIIIYDRQASQIIQPSSVSAVKRDLQAQIMPPPKPEHFRSNTVLAVGGATSLILLIGCLAAHYKLQKLQRPPATGGGAPAVV